MEQAIQFADIEVQPELDFNTPTRRIDPAFIQLSPWANRHEASFLTTEFAEFTHQSEIKSTKFELK
jgi:hypothetical protein